MDETINFELPYPECEQPLVADASDVIQLKNLADAVDETVQGLYDDASRTIVHPDAARMQSTSVLMTSTTLQMVVSYDQFNFDNTPSQLMTDTANGVILIQETGWYLVTHFAIADPSGAGAVPRISIRLLVNGSATTPWSVKTGNALIGAATGIPAQDTQTIRLSAGDTVTTEVINEPAVGPANWTIEARIAALQLLAI